MAGPSSRVAPAIANPGFALTAILSLAVGIGANAIFQLLNAVRLRSLPVERPEELVEIRIEGEGRMGNFRGRNPVFSNALWEQLREQQRGLAAVAAWGDTAVNLAPKGEERRAEGLWVSAASFQCSVCALSWGVCSVLKMTAVDVETRESSSAFGQREFGGNPDVLSRTLSLGDQSVPVP